MTSIFSNILTLNFTHLCLNSPREEFNGLRNGTEEESKLSDNGKHVSELTISIVAMIATFPFSHWCSHHGAKYLFLIAGLFSSVATAFQVVVIERDWHVSWLIAVKAAQGLAYAADFAVMGVVCTRWASLSETAIFISAMTCFSPLASIVTYAASGVICVSPLGWQWISYSHAIFTMFLFLCWAIFYTDAAQDNRFVTHKELDTIFDAKTEAHRNRVPFVPYKAIFKSKTVWTVWLNAFADLFSGYFLILYAPNYLGHVLGYDIVNIGFISAIINTFIIPVKLSSGFLSDCIGVLSNRHKLWLFNSTALLLPAVCYIVICYVPTDIPLITIILFGVISAAIGFNAGGFYKCGALISRQYAEVVIAFTQFIKCAVFFIAPGLMTIFVPNESEAAQWHPIFYLIAASMIFANIVFLFYASDQPRSFTKITAPNRDNVVNEKMTSTSVI
ncbi:major facilitator superfamily domain-containing protein [Ditylenchus destructor]|nr:major facilitator superfamily domain-containing protein [Ditylenchus destructor]